MNVGGVGRRPATNNRAGQAVLSAIIGMLVFGSVAAAAQAANVVSTGSEPRPPATTAFQCQKRFHTNQGRSRCYSRLPGADCAHPLEVQKTNPNYRGDTFAFSVQLEEDAHVVAADVTWEWHTKPNVEICPHGVLFHYSTRVGGKGQEHYDPVVSSSHSGRLTKHFANPEPDNWYLIIRGRYIHPPWEGTGSAQEAAAGPRRKAIESLEPKTAFQCEKQFKAGQARDQCFSELPGANCAHPLIAEKAGDTTRGEHRFFRLGFRGDSYFGPPQGAELHYSYAPATSNVAMCPYPMGAVYKDSLLYEEENHCETSHRNGHAVYECHSEYDTHNHPEPVGRHGGSFTFDLKSPRTGYLVVKGYFIHPPWEH